MGWHLVGPGSVPCPSTEHLARRKQDQWDRFTEASDDATLALADPEICAHYEAEARKQDLQPRNVAMADYIKGKNLLSKSSE